MSELDDYTRDSGFTPSPAVRRLIAKVRAEASTRGNRGELGAWMFTFARLATMSEAVLEERGCPADEIDPLLRFAMAEAVDCVSPVSPVEGARDLETVRQTSKYIAQFARLRWGTRAGADAEDEWIENCLCSGSRHLGAERVSA